MKVITDAGATIAIGDTEAAPTIGIVDYSRRVTDDFGVTTVVERGFSRTMSIKAAVPFDQVSTLQLQLADLRAEPATWVADDRFASLVVRGFFKDLRFDFASPPISYCTLTVEGLASAEPLPDDVLDPGPGGQLSTLQVLRPVEVTGGMLSYSSVAEDDAPEWAAGATYPAGARVMLRAEHRIYESLIPLNTGKHPVDTVGAWLDAGPTNRWAMFDQALGTVTRADRQLQVTVAAGAVNAVALIDIKADTVRLQSGGYDRTASATSGTVTFLDMPDGTAPVTITVIGDAGVEIGTLLVGQLASLGITEASPTAAITDFSRKVIDDFGEVTIVKRAFAKTMSARALIDTAAVDLVAARIANVRARPCLWIGQDGIAALTIYGFFREFSVEIGETLSKLSLSIEGMSSAAKLKPLGSLVNWDDVANPTGTKPADNATNTAKPDAPFGPGATVGSALLTIEKVPSLIERVDAIEPAMSDVDALKEAAVGQDKTLEQLGQVTVDHDALIRQAERAAGRIDDALLRQVMESARTRQVLRDAGIVIDPTTAEVRIYAIDQQAERIARAEVAINAQKGTIALKADSAYVDEQIALAVLDPAQVAELEPIIKRLASAELTIDGLSGSIVTKAEVIELGKVDKRVTGVSERVDALAGEIEDKVEKTTFEDLGKTVQSISEKLSTVGDTTGLSLTIRQARIIADDAATAATRASLSGDEAVRRQIIQAAEAREDVYTRIVAGELTEARARLALAAEVGDVRAMALRETATRIADDQAIASDVRALGVTSRDQAAAIGENAEAILTAAGGVARTQTTIRQVVGRADESDEAILRALVNGDTDSRARRDQLVQIQTEFATSLVANDAASAVARQALLVRMAAAEAAIVETSRVLATTTQALAERIRAAEAIVLDPATGLAATRARLIDEEKLSADRDKVTSGKLSLLEAAVDDPKTGLAVTRAQLADEVKLSADRDGAMGERVDGLVAEFSDPATGLGATRAQLVDEVKLSADRDGAMSERVDALVAEFDDPAAGLAATRAQLADEVKLSADRNGAMGERVDGLESVITNPDTGLAAVDASVGRLAETTAKADEANAKLIEQVRVKLGDLGEATVSDLIKAVVKANGDIMATKTVAIDVNGNLVGTQLVGSSEGRGSLGLINADLQMGDGRIIMNTGTMMLATGVGFGAQRDLLLWFGPTMALEQCSRTNGQMYLPTTGQAYFGGGLSAGSLTVPATNPSLAADAIAELPRFGSNGKPVRYIASWSYTFRRVKSYTPDNEGLRDFKTEAQRYNAATDDGFDYFGSVTEKQPASTITLKRAFAGSSYEQLKQVSFDTQTLTMSGTAPTPGDAPGTATFTTTIGGGFTIVDPTQTVADRTVQLVLARGFGIIEDGSSQRLSIVSVEE
ncbi:hypothetical protein [uncultured Sphingomonas sp.]|uniref:hypothetical protein n=1 Tax=uncultured Sphingomonas sp. TaxID=158754 RepID=UPI0025D3ABB2|nr:hypothetical protein [uncultured Sphingomonas sp.]